MFECLALNSLWPCFSRRTRVFFFEGNVGVGKTECMHGVASMLREKGHTVLCIEEDVDRWVNEGLLAAKYQSDESVFSAYALLQDYLCRRERVNDAVQKQSHEIILVERHPSTSLKVFGIGSNVRVKMLFETVAVALPDFLSTAGFTIYIKNSPHTCFERTKRRNRVDEKGLSEFSFEEWGKAHDDMMTEREAMGGKVFTFDAFGADSHQLSPSIVSCMGF
jgi:thymidylate kinase